MPETPLTADWLAATGFKWHQLDRQPEKHWLLWIGSAIREGPDWRHTADSHDLGVELAPSVYTGQWHCWLRSDVAHRYGRFLHVRHLSTQEDVIRLIEGLTGLPWHPEDALYGVLHTPEQAGRIRQKDTRLDRVWATQPPYWRTCETDPTQGTALPEHLEHFMTGRAE